MWPRLVSSLRLFSLRYFGANTVRASASVALSMIMCRSVNWEQCHVHAVRAERRCHVIVADAFQDVGHTLVSSSSHPVILMISSLEAQPVKLAAPNRKGSYELVQCDGHLYSIQRRAALVCGVHFEGQLTAVYQFTVNKNLVTRAEEMLEELSP
jgi:hypothetical protein